METQEFQSPQNPKTQSKEPISEEHVENKDTIISPRFRSVAAMAGWDEDALLSATLIVEDTPEREISNKKRVRFPLTSSTSSRRKRRAQRNNPAAPPSYPIVILNLDDDDDDDKTVGKAKNDSKKTEKPKLQALDENPLPVEDSAAASSSSDTALPCMDQLREELSCAICLEICFEPSTTPCGHSFCMKCLKSAADKCGKRCPKCRQLVGNGRSCTVNTVLWNTIQLLFPQEVEARKAAGAVNSREAASKRPEAETHNPRIRSTRSSAVMINEVSVRRSREIPRQNPNVTSYNGRTRSSRSSTVVTNEVSVRRGRGVPIQAEDAALAFRLQREEFMEAFRGTDDQSRTTSVSSTRGTNEEQSRTTSTRGTDELSRTTSVSSTRADIRARALRAISLRSGQPM